MSKAEEKYRYLVNKDKYDPKVTQAVGKKMLSHSDANKVNKIQEMMQKEKEARRTVVTSENREEFMKNKLGAEKVPDFGNGPHHFHTSVMHKEKEHFSTGKVAKHSEGYHEAEYDHKGSRVWAQPGGKNIREE